MNIESEIRQYIFGELLQQGSKDFDSDYSILLDLDSLDIQNLILFLEEKFAIQVNELDVTFDNFRSISAIAKFVERKLMDLCPAS